MVTRAKRFRPTPGLRKEVLALTRYQSPDAARIRALDAEVERLKSTLTQSRPQHWEAAAAERDALKARVRELEAQLDECIDAMTKAELRGTPSSVRTVGRPRGRKAPKRKPARKPAVVAACDDCTPADRADCATCSPVAVVKVPRARPVPKTNRRGTPRLSKGAPL